MSKKDAFFNPYRPGDENHLYFSDPKILKHFLAAISFVEAYFRYETVGIKNIPKNSGALLIANHGFIPMDLFLLAARVFRQTRRRIRVLVHRRSWRIPVLREAALNLGLVDANPENAVRLLKRGELVCVFPGGEREGLKPSSRKYELMWEGRYGFAKTAIQAGVPIVSCMSVGIDDMFHVFNRAAGPVPALFHRFLPFPIFMGLGGLPLPVKIRHYVGKPIYHGLKPADARKTKVVKELHARAWEESKKLLRQGLARRRLFGFL